MASNRNEPCPCASGKKYKKCCINKPNTSTLNAHSSSIYHSTPKPGEDRPDPTKKGVYGENCNRTACQKPTASYFNHSTEKYYCATCADMINNATRSDSYDLYGHDLCTYGEHKQ